MSKKMTSLEHLRSASLEARGLIARVAGTAAEAIEELGSRKQDKLTGASGQVVGFDAAGKPVAQSTASLVGPKGDTGATGAAGKTAYQYAVEGGYAGTEAEFKALLGLTGTIAANLDEINGEVI